MKDSMPLDCFGYRLAMTKGVRLKSHLQLLTSNFNVIASECNERGNQPSMNTRHVWLLNTVDCFANARNDKWQCAFNRTRQYHNSSRLLDTHAPMRPFAHGGENRVPFALERGGDILNRCAVIEQNLEQCAAWQL